VQLDTTCPLSIRVGQEWQDASYKKTVLFLVFYFTYPCDIPMTPESWSGPTHTPASEQHRSYAMRRHPGAHGLGGAFSTAPAQKYLFVEVAQSAAISAWAYAGGAVWRRTQLRGEAYVYALFSDVQRHTYRRTLHL
jgi:hypothetical protein